MHDFATTVPGVRIHQEASQITNLQVLFAPKRFLLCTKSIGMIQKPPNGEQPADSREPVSISRSREILQQCTYLKLNVCLSNVLCATATACNLLCLRNLALDSLSAEVVKRVSLGRVDTKNRVGLDGSEASGNWKVMRQPFNRPSMELYASLDSRKN